MRKVNFNNYDEVIADKGVVIRQEWKLHCSDGRKPAVIEKKRVF
jgi:hypothetical protein